MPIGVKKGETRLTDEERRANKRALGRKYQKTPKQKANRKKVHENNRFKILEYYSKTLSNSDIPCCRCCGFNEHIDFLAIDHIAGKKQMDSIPELVKLGYSSEMQQESLKLWIIRNDFPDGFQTLCHNCNMAKGFYGKCPHETMEWNGNFDSTTAKRV